MKLLSVLVLSYFLLACDADESFTSIDMTDYFYQPGYIFEFKSASGYDDFYRYQNVTLNGYALIEQTKYENASNVWYDATYSAVEPDGIYTYDDTTGALELTIPTLENVQQNLFNGLYVTVSHQDTPVPQLSDTPFAGCNDLIHIAVHREYIDDYDGSSEVYGGDIYFARGIGRLYQEWRFTSSNNPYPYQYDDGTEIQFDKLQIVKDMQTLLPVELSSPGC